MLTHLEDLLEGNPLDIEDLDLSTDTEEWPSDPL